MKPIFNSLGSNYKFGFVCLALRQILLPRRKNLGILKAELEKMFGGNAHLFYKGRDAIEFILRAYGIGNNDRVLTQSLTCCAVEEAVKRAGATPVFVDVEMGELNFSPATLEQTARRTKNVRAVIVQHTLGSPAQIVQIKKWCNEHKLLLIEDLAQSLGGLSPEGKPLGSYGDAVVLSFGRDKIIDAISGGVAILKAPPRHTPVVPGRVNAIFVMRDMLYPLLTWKVRLTHKFILGKIIFRFSRLIGLSVSAVSSSTKSMSPMPPAYAKLALVQLKKIKSNLEHRRKIAKVYLKKLDRGIEVLTSEEVVKLGSNLRFAFTSTAPNELIYFLKKKGVYISDRWYRAPVDCGELKFNSIYLSGSCPNSEALAQKIINLPTHINIEEGDASRIAHAVNKFLR